MRERGELVNSKGERGLALRIWVKILDKGEQIRTGFSKSFQTADSDLCFVGPSAKVVTGCWSFTGSRIHWK